MKYADNSLCNRLVKDLDFLNTWWKSSTQCWNTMQHAVLIDLNVKCKPIELLDENIWENLHDLEFSDEWLHITAQVWYVKEKINKLDFTKIKNPALRKNLL